MPEAGGAATFVRRAFSDPLGFVTGWLLFLDYLVVIALAALFVPHYLGAAFGWEALHGPAPGTPSSAIGVIVALAAVRRTRRVRLYPIAVVVAALALSRRLLLAILGFALVFNPDVLRFGTDLGRDAVVGVDRAGALAGDARLHRPRDASRTSPPRSREPGRTLPRSLFIGIGIVVVINVAVSIVGSPPTRRVPTRRAPTAWPPPSAPTGSQAPLVGIAPAIGEEMPWGGDALEVFVGVTNALVLVTIIATAMAGGERLAYSMARYDMLPHAFARPERGPAPTAGRDPRGRRDRAGADRGRRRGGRRGALPRRPLQLRRAHRDDAAQFAVVRLRIHEPDLGAALPRARLACRGGARRPAAAARRRAAHVRPLGRVAVHPRRRGDRRPGVAALGAVVYLRVAPGRRRDAAGARDARRCPTWWRAEAEGRSARRHPRAAQARDIGEEVLATALRLAEDRGAEVRGATSCRSRCRCRWRPTSATRSSAALRGDGGGPGDRRASRA